MKFNWIGVFTSKLPRSVNRRLRSMVLGLVLYSVAVAVVDHFLDQWFKDIHPTVHTLLGAILGFLLVFRTNTAYDRWWEGRKLWGQLINDTRSLALKVRSLPDIDPEEARQFGRFLYTYARALKEHLRDGVRPKQLSLYGQIDHEPQHVPAHIVSLMHEQIRAWKTQGRLDGFDELLFDPHIRSFMDICGACERIRKTPIPSSYLTVIRQSIALYLVTLPWGLVTYRFWMIPAVAIIAYFMIGIEFVAEEVEEPFGHTEDDLMLDDLCKSIEASVNEILPPPQPQKDLVLGPPSL